MKATWSSRARCVVRLDTVTLEAELAEANAGVAAAKEKMAVATANIARRKSEIELAEIEAERSRKLVEERAGLAAGATTCAG